MIQISRKKQNVIGKILCLKGLWNKYFSLLGWEHTTQWSGPVMICLWSTQQFAEKVQHEKGKEGNCQLECLRNFYPNPIKHVHLINGYYLNIWYNSKCIKEITCFKSMRKLFNSLMLGDITDSCQDAKIAKWRAH